VAAVAGAGAGAASSLTGPAAAAALAGPGEDALEPPVPETFVSLAHVQGQMRQSSLTMVSKLVEKHPDEALSLLRRWLGPQEAGQA
jgi:flagellar M-ring protein FliF